MKTAKRMILFLMMGVGMIMHGAGCDAECTSGDDFPDENGNFQGAICVDGHLQCADGSEICPYFDEEANGKRVLRWGCNPTKCIYCPEGKLLCSYDTDPYGNDYSWTMCVDDVSDCLH